MLKKHRSRWLAGLLNNVSCWKFKYIPTPLAYQKKFNSWQNSNSQTFSYSHLCIWEFTQEIKSISYSFHCPIWKYLYIIVVNQNLCPQGKTLIKKIFFLLVEPIYPLDLFHIFFLWWEKSVFLLSGLPPPPLLVARTLKKVIFLMAVAEDFFLLLFSSHLKIKNI